MFYRTLVLLLIAACFWAVAAHGSGASGSPGRYYVVTQGDTLWSIADRFYGGDTREGVWLLERQNDLSGDTVILAGERIRLPW